MGDNSDAILKSYVERIERLQEEKDGLTTDIREIYVEAKSNGFDTKILRLLIRERKLTAAERAERDALLETYKDALGMLSDTPLGEAALRAAG